MPEISFRCPRPFCFTAASIDTAEVKLLRTIVSKNGSYPELDWTIYTCPKCLETYQVDPRTEYGKHVISVAFKTSIGGPGAG